MNEKFVQSAEVQTLLDRASGRDSAGGDPRLKVIVRDVLESAMTIIARHDISESEFWPRKRFTASVRLMLIVLSSSICTI